MISRTLSLLVILPAFAFGLLFVSGAFAPPQDVRCGTAEMAAMMFWLILAVASVATPALLAGFRALCRARTGELGRLALLALGGHVAIGLVAMVGNAIS